MEYRTLVLVSTVLSIYIMGGFKLPLNVIIVGVSAIIYLVAGGVSASFDYARMPLVEAYARLKRSD